MKRSPPRLLPLVLAAVVVASCADETGMTGPEEAPRPEMSTLTEDDVEPLVGYLIDQMFPPRGLLRAAQTRWRNIRRKWDQELAEDARIQVIAFVSWLPDLLAARHLGVPDMSGHPDYGYVSTPEEGASFLTDLLFRFVGYDAPGIHPDVFGADDSGFGPIGPDGGVVVTDRQWAAVAAGAGATDKTVLVTIVLEDQYQCDLPTGISLNQSLGCWDINRYPAGAFNENVVVEACVADPGESAMTDEEYYHLQRLHKSDGSVVTELPWTTPQHIDCGEFTIGGPEGLAGRQHTETLWGSLRSGLASLVLPEPLWARPMWRRPPVGLGGLVGSFTWFFGAVPDYADVAVGTGVADSWTVEEPSSATYVCSGSPCDAPAETSVTFQAVARGPSGVMPIPWSTVYFYYRHPSTGDPVLIGRTAIVAVTDGPTGRAATYSMSLEGSGLPVGSLEVFAVGVEPDGDAFRTPSHTNVAIIAGPMGSISGTVTLEGWGTAWGATLEPIVLTGVSVADEDILLHARTDLAGDFEFSAVPPGVYDLEIVPSAPDFVFDPASKEVVHPLSGAPATVDFSGYVILTASISGRAFVPGLGMGGADLPLVNRRVRIYGAQPQVIVHTAADGTYDTGPVLRAGTVVVELWVVDGGVVPGNPLVQEVSLGIGETRTGVDFPVELAEGSGSITGRVTVGGAGVAGVSVTAYYGVPPEDYALAMSTETDAEGSYTFVDVPVGYWRVCVDAVSGESCQGGLIVDGTELVFDFSSG